MPAIIHPLGTPLAYELDFAPPFEPTICFESQQHVMTPPTLSVLETQILTASTYPYTELFRSTFINSCTTSTWNVSIARTVLWYANSVSISNILNDLYPGLNPNTGILCLRQRTTYIDTALTSLYPAYYLFVAELAKRQIPTPHQNLLSQSVTQSESPVYRTCGIAASVVLSAILTLRGS